MARALLPEQKNRHCGAAMDGERKMYGKNKTPETTRESNRTRLSVNVYGQTDAGRVRSTNQDHFLIASLQRRLDVLQTSLEADDCVPPDVSSQGWILMVADGMGGQAGGEEASSLTIEQSLRYLSNTMPWFLRMGEDHPEKAEEALRTIVRRCNQDVLSFAADKSPRKSRMGTTLTLAYVLWPQLFVVNAGDSRCYLLRDHALRQVTRDHTIAQQLVEHDVLNAEQAEESIHAHVLTKVVGGGEEGDLEADVNRLELRHDDTVLLCTDGLTNLVPDEQILELLERERLANDRCGALIAAANEAGGSDNITAVVASFQQRSV
jgi:protein phosphatase